ncbi:MAG: feruloyl-CoA synthase [Candidatus Protistobacter heckmanni]|nr:feruloyl-CoA synthase [Candidatus Protistobacter heckmanni]
MSKFRQVSLARPDIHIETLAGGAAVVRSMVPLQSFGDNMAERLIHFARTAPDRTWMAQRVRNGQPGGGEWRHINYAQALDSARRIGESLLQRGLSAERPLVILSENDLEHAQLALGALYAGVPFAPVSTAYSLVSQDFEKLRHILKLLTPGLVFAADGARYGKAIDAVLPDMQAAGITLPELAATANAFPGRATTLFSELLASTPGERVDAAQRAVGPDSIAKFLFTSRSTKQPKAVVNTQRMICSAMQSLGQCWPFLTEEPPVVVDWLPWNHTFGGNQCFHIPLYHGGSFYIDEGKPVPGLFDITLRNLRDISPTLYMNVPKGWEELARALPGDEVLRKSYYRKLKMQFYAGASLGQPVWDNLYAASEAECGERIVMTSGLGMTETSPGAIWVLQQAARAGQVGVPGPGVEIKLVPESEDEGCKTELRYRGPNVTPGYWRQPEETEGAFDADGFFCSGDALLWVDKDQPQLGFKFDGRVAEDFKLVTGTWVSVGPLRMRGQSAGLPHFVDSVVTGQDRSEVDALLVPNQDAIRALAPALPRETPFAEVLHQPAVRELIQRFVDRMWREGTGSANRLARAAVLTTPPSLDKGEVTDKGSINQRAVLKHRAALVETLYAATREAPAAGDAEVFFPTKD